MRRMGRTSTTVPRRKEIIFGNIAAVYDRRTLKMALVADL
jgi:hypothetical protein